MLPALVASLLALGLPVQVHVRAPTSPEARLRLVVVAPATIRADQYPGVLRSAVCQAVGDAPAAWLLPAEATLYVRREYGASYGLEPRLWLTVRAGDC